MGENGIITTFRIRTCNARIQTFNRPGQARTAQDRSGQTRTELDRPGQSWTDLDRPGRTRVTWHTLPLELGQFRSFCDVSSNVPYTIPFYAHIELTMPLLNTNAFLKYKMTFNHFICRGIWLRVIF